MFQKIAFSSIAFLLFACAHAPKPQVERGMSRTQVEAVLGAPADRTFEGHQENWVYPSEGGKKLILFEDDKVVGMFNADEKMPVLHEVGKNGVNPNSSHEGQCVGTNRYGKFASGGGCNMYGCYPAGGYCNGFGCSSAGRCTNEECPNKIKTYQCKE